VHDSVRHINTSIHTYPKTMEILPLAHRNLVKDCPGKGVAPPNRRHGRLYGPQTRPEPVSVLTVRTCNRCCARSRYGGGAWRRAPACAAG
jgi:hypothetical protein